MLRANQSRPGSSGTEVKFQEEVPSCRSQVTGLFSLDSVGRGGPSATTMDARTIDRPIEEK